MKFLWIFSSLFKEYLPYFPILFLFLIFLLVGVTVRRNPSISFGTVHSSKIASEAGLWTVPPNKMKSWKHLYYTCNSKDYILRENISIRLESLFILFMIIYLARWMNKKQTKKSSISSDEWTKTKVKPFISTLYA